MTARGELEAQHILRQAITLVKAKGIQVGATIEHKIADRLTVTMKPAVNGNANSLTVMRHDKNQALVVLSAIWHDDNDEPPMIIVCLAGPWKWLLRRAVELMPVSVVPT